MKTLTKIGLIFLIIGFLLFAVLLAWGLWSVGSWPPENSPPPSLLDRFVMSFIELGSLWFVFVIAGVILLVAGHFQRKPSKHHERFAQPKSPQQT